MHVSSVKYEKLVSLGNYENQKIGVVVELEPDESPSEALRRAKAFVEQALGVRAPSEFEIERANVIIANPDEYSPRHQREAQALLDKRFDDVPF